MFDLDEVCLSTCAPIAISIWLLRSHFCYELLMAKRILITGGSGFIGSALARYLITQADDEICVIDKDDYGRGLLSLTSHLRFTFHQINILDAERVRYIIKNFNPNIIVHLAAETHVDTSIDNPKIFIESNILGTFNLLQISFDYYKNLSDQNKALFRFYYVSTDEVYGSLQQDDHAFHEMSHYNPSSPYSASKVSAEHLTYAWWRTFGLPVLLTSCSNNYGPYQKFEKLIPHIIQQALQHKPIPIYGNGKNIRDWLYVDDHVRAMHKVICNAKIGSHYCISAEQEYCNIDVANMVCSILDRLAPRPDQLSYRTQIQFVADRKGHDFRYGLSADKIKKELHWAPLYDFAQGLEATVQWYVDHKSFL